MSLKYVAAYLMVSLTGQESPSAMDVKNVLNSVGAEVDETILNKLISVMEGKVIHEVKHNLTPISLENGFYARCFPFAIG